MFVQFELFDYSSIYLLIFRFFKVQRYGMDRLATFIKICRVSLLGKCQNVAAVNAAVSSLQKGSKRLR